MPLSLNCHILGRGSNWVTTFEFQEQDDVSALTSRIWTSYQQPFSTPNTGCILPEDIYIYNTTNDLSVDEFEHALKNINFKSRRQLGSRAKLRRCFPDLENHPNALHVVVYPPHIELNCFIDCGNKTPLVARISARENVAALQEYIHQSRPDIPNNIKPHDIELFLSSSPRSALDSGHPTVEISRQLKPGEQLRGVFPSWTDPDYIQIIARVAGRRNHRPPPSSFRYQISMDTVGDARVVFSRSRVAEAPSSGGQPDKFWELQAGEDTFIACNRPRHREITFPITLLHPVFGNFVDHCQNHTPTNRDANLARDLANAMVTSYSTENQRKAALLALFTQHGLYVRPTVIDKYTTDGDISVGAFKSLIAELKNEIGSTGAEPYFQLCLYYLEATREKAVEHPKAVLPCILIIVFGSYIAFAGAAWSDRPVVQMLSTAIPCHYHSTDSQTEMMLARHLGALRRALGTLETFYSNYNPDPPCHPCYPYPTSFESHGTTHDFTVTTRMKRHNVFFGLMGDDTLCIKYVARYGQEAHELLASRNLAPKLYAIQRVPGGLFMVVMTDLGEDYISLYNYIQDYSDIKSDEHRQTRDSFTLKVAEALKILHEAGYVHGDVRNTNIMVKKSPQFQEMFYLIDFDWSGKEDEARYPLNVNPDVKRPTGAVSCEKIRAEHDEWMLNYIWG